MLMLVLWVVTHVYSSVNTNVLEEHTSSIFKVQLIGAKAVDAFATFHRAGMIIIVSTITRH